MSVLPFYHISRHDDDDHRVPRRTSCPFDHDYDVRSHASILYHTRARK